MRPYDFGLGAGVDDQRVAGGIGRRRAIPVSAIDLEFALVNDGVARPAGDVPRAVRGAIEPSTADPHRAQTGLVDAEMPVI